MIILARDEFSFSFYPPFLKSRDSIVPALLLSCGYGTPAAVVNGWINSGGHRANILNASYTQISVGYCAGGNYWTQMFIG